MLGKLNIMSKISGICSVTLLLTGCLSLDRVELQHSQMSAEITESEQRLATMIDQHCQMDQQKLLADISTLMNDKSRADKKAEAPPKVVYKERCSTPAVVAGITMNDDKLTLGQIEQVTLINEQRTFDARIDTGAVTSSLGAFNITRFERDGKKWVEFTLDKDEEAKRFKYPIKRFIRIAVTTTSKASRRVVIQLNFSLGKETYNSEFSLTDRSHLDYQVLIGREFLLDRAVVDVSGKHLIKRE